MKISIMPSGVFYQNSLLVIEDENSAIRFSIKIDDEQLLELSRSAINSMKRGAAQKRKHAGILNRELSKSNDGKSDA